MMSPSDAAKILDLPADTSPEQLEARFNELRRKLEDKIARAPTPGLQAKYRETLAEITTAFETLILAADSSSLPVAQKSGGPASLQAASDSAGSPPAGSPNDSAPSSRLHAPGPTRRKSGGKEFLLVSVVAILLLGAGGWYVMKTRAENAEAARLAAEALQKKEADERAEAARLANLKTSLRTRLAEARVEWEANESILQDAERRASELKSELRGLRDAPAAKKAELSAEVTAHDLYARWLKNHLLRHPAKLARVQAEEMLQAGALDETSAAVEQVFTALGELNDEIEDRRHYFFISTTDLRLHTKPEGVRWILTDPYGRTQEGKTPAQLTNLPLTHLVTDGVTVAPFTGVEQRGEFTTGKISVRFVRPGWPEVVRETTSLRKDNDILEAEFPEGSLVVTSQPAGVPFHVEQTGATPGWSASGTTPATLTGVPPGRVNVRLVRPGFRDVTHGIDIVAGQAARTPLLDHRAQPVRITVDEPAARITVDGKGVGRQQAELNTLAPGEHSLLLELNGYKPYRTTFTTEQKATPVALSFSFKQLATENITCTPCRGTGSIQQKGRCNQCNGSGRIDCSDCRNGIAGYVDGDYGGGVIGQKMVMCTSCNRKGYFICESCTKGTATWQVTCTNCSGDGRVSKLQLSP